MVQVVVLSTNGEQRTLKTSLIPTGTSVTGELVAKALRRVKAAAKIGTYKWKSQTLTVWGWEGGKAGSENKHELPPPHDEILLFGDVIVTSNQGDFTVEMWAQFYDAAFGGFEDIDGSDDDADDTKKGKSGGKKGAHGGAGSEESDEEGDSEEEDEEDAGEEDEDFEETEADEGDDTEEAEESGDDVEDEDGDAGDDSEAEAEEADEDDDCYDDGDDGGGGKRRAPRRRTVAAPEYRRIDMGLRSRIKIPAPLGKRAPKLIFGGVSVRCLCAHESIH
jgi:hypothetical protein